jgi:RNA polymerase sigma-70 factor (ECF subfamily)
MKDYCGAVYRYLLAVLHDPNEAEELAQEFALRFVRGDFWRADPERGRFRDYVKTVLYHLIVDHHAKRRAQPGPLPADSGEQPLVEPDTERHEREFLNGWREELLNRAWEGLAVFSQQADNLYYTVLRWRAENPDIPASRLADDLTTQFGKPFTETGVRQVLHRARKKFADLLVAEVARSLQSPSPEQLEQELIDLGLLPFCQMALKSRQ